MRYFLLLICSLPLVAVAQLNRSARELAGETTHTWLAEKLFHGDGNAFETEPVMEVKAWADKDSRIKWTATQIVFSKGITPDFQGSPARSGERIRYGFTFYLDERMRVLAAESVSRRSE